MQSVLIRLREAERDFSPTERTIAHYIAQQPERILRMNVRSLAETTYTSPSAVIRLCKRLGFSGYRELHQTLTLELAQMRPAHTQPAETPTPQDTIAAVMEKVTYRNILSLEDTRRLQDTESMAACVRLLLDCNSVILFGIGSSLCVARDAQLKFLRMNKPCFLHDDWHSQLLQARNAGPNDLGIAFSYSGNTLEVADCMRALKENGTPCIAITRYATSPVSELATYNLYTAATENLFRSGAMSSRISQLNVVDILFTLFANSDYEASLRQLGKTHIHKPHEAQTDIPFGAN